MCKRQKSITEPYNFFATNPGVKPKIGEFSPKWANLGAPKIWRYSNPIKKIFLAVTIQWWFGGACKISCILDDF